MRITSFVRSAFRRVAWNGAPLDEDKSIISRGEDLWDGQVAEEEEYARRRFTQKCASWRKMLVSQPPPLHLGFLWTDMDSYDSHVKRVKCSKAMIKTGDNVRFRGLSMGELYDLVQYHAGHYERDSLYFRVLWGLPPIKPFVSVLDRDICEELLSHTSVMVDLSSHGHGYLAQYFPAPTNLGDFEAAFRRDEYRPASLEISELVGQPNDGGWAYSRSIW